MNNFKIKKTPYKSPVLKAGIYKPEIIYTQYDVYDEETKVIFFRFQELHKSYKLKINLRRGVSKLFKRKDIRKKSKTEDILGISFEEFKQYIESLFQEGMSWENYGEWHIDHKKPVSWANSEEELYELNHYTNLQPLWATENLSKKDRYESL